MPREPFASVGKVAPAVLAPLVIAELHADPRAALLGATPPDQGVEAPVAIGRLAGDSLLDRGQQLVFQLRSATAPLAARLRCRLDGPIGTRHAEGIGDRLHGVSSRAGEGARNSRFFGGRNVRQRRCA